MRDPPIDARLGGEPGSLRPFPLVERTIPRSEEAKGPWGLVRAQHGVISRGQLLAFGIDSHGIQRRLDRGRLHRVWRGVYAVGRPELTMSGRWMAAVLACGPEAVLSHTSAGGIWAIHTGTESPIHVTVPATTTRVHPGIRVHRRARLASPDTSRCMGVPVTSPARTLVDLGTCLSPRQLEAAINEADKRSLVSPETLRSKIAKDPRLRGAGALRRILDRADFVLTDSELERRFLPLARRAGLPTPQTGRYVNGFKADFYWPDLGLIVETDGLRYHRTAAQQVRDTLRDQVHTAAGLTTLRYAHWQIRYDGVHVLETLSAVARRCGGAQADQGRRGPPPSA